MTFPGPTASCPKCGSTSVQVTQIRPSSVPKGVATEYYQGTTQGGAGGSDTIPQLVCLSCGCRWIPRTKQERYLKALSGQLGPEAMRAAQAKDAAESAQAKRSALAKIPPRTWAIAVVLAIVLLLALLT
jgi:hypothetical protein